MRCCHAVAAAAVLLIEVAIALWLHDAWVRPYGGDVLAVVLVYLCVRAVTRWRWPTAVAAALGVAVLVELGQLAGVATRLGFVRGSAGEVVLGSGFDPSDFVAYALGGLAVVVVEWRRGRGVVGEPSSPRKRGPITHAGELGPRFRGDDAVS